MGGRSLNSAVIIPSWPNKGTKIRQHFEKLERKCKKIMREESTSKTDWTGSRSMWEPSAPEVSPICAGSTGQEGRRTSRERTLRLLSQGAWSCESPKTLPSQRKYRNALPSGTHLSSFQASGMTQAQLHQRQPVGVHCADRRGLKATHCSHVRDTVYGVILCVSRSNS